MATALKEVFRATIQLAPSVYIGPVNGGVLRVIPMTGGRVTGERLNADVLPIGADWNLARNDGVVYLSARYVLRSDDGAFISILNEGWGRQSDETMAAIMRGEAVEKTGWYCKTHPRFETADPRYHWMNETTFVCELEAPTGADSVQLIYYELL